MATKFIPLYAYENWVTDKESFKITSEGRFGDTPSIAMDAGSPELAHLIAAAPDLYVALENLLSEVQFVDPAVPEVFLANAQAALTKAQGEA